MASQSPQLTAWPSQHCNNSNNNVMPRHDHYHDLMVVQAGEQSHQGDDEGGREECQGKGQGRSAAVNRCIASGWSQCIITQTGPVRAPTGSCRRAVQPVNHLALQRPFTMRFRSTAKVLAKCQLKYYRISECPSVCFCDAPVPLNLPGRHSWSI